MRYTLFLFMSLLLPLHCPAAEVDYFGEFEKLYIDKLNPPEDNGLRLMIAACGPRILEQWALSDLLSWEEIPTHEHGKLWFEGYWTPLCEHLSLDPHKKPRFYKSESFYSYMRLWRQKEEGEVNTEKDQTLWTHLAGTPWKSEEHPQVAAWLKDRDVVLDYFGHCVRKPNYVSWRKPSDEGMYAILLPDVQAQREFSRDLRVRITYRLGLGDTEGAWYDVMSMLTLARKHYKNDPLLVTNFVGTSIERYGYEAAKTILKQDGVTKVQFERFSHELNALPPCNSYRDSLLSERYMIFDYIRIFDQNRKQFHEFLKGMKENKEFKEEKLFGKFGNQSIDQEIARNHSLQLHEDCKPQRITYEEMFANRLYRRQYIENLDKKTAEIQTALEKHVQIESNFARKETRSLMLADWMFTNFTPSLLPVDKIYNNCDSELTLLKIAFALERYKIDRGEYPEKLDSLLFDYLEEIPIDPSTSRDTITYKKEGDKFLLYSYGPNQKDDGGKDDPRRIDGDIVF